MSKSFTKNVLKACGACLAVALFASCGADSGLGASVDTEPPVLAISYPPANAIVSGQFLFSGAASDDKGIDHVKVTVKDSDANELYTTSVNPDKDGIWTAELNKKDDNNFNSYNGWQFADGTYNIYATAYDKAGRSSGTSSYQTIVIDNTAPVLVITSPSSVGSDSPKQYGQTVQLVGTFSEMSDGGKISMVVDFFDENGKNLLSTDFKNIIDMSNANPLTIAQYYPPSKRPGTDQKDDYRKWNNYRALYGDKYIADYEAYSNGTTDKQPEDKKFYFTVSATDSARTYQNTKEINGTGDGNWTDTYYRSTSKFQTLIEGKNENYKGFSVLSLRNYLNKTDDTYQASEDLKSILGAARSASSQENNTQARSIAAIENNNNGSGKISGISDISENIQNTDSSKGQVYLNFQVNPLNNPTFLVSGYIIEPERNDDKYSKANSANGNLGGYRSYTMESNLVVEVQPGLDQTKIKKSTVSVYVIPTAESADEEKILVWTYNKDVAIANAVKKYGMTKDAATSAIEALTVSSDTYRYEPTREDAITDSIKFETSLSDKDGLVSGKTYTFTASGFDNDDKAVVAQKTAGYGIWATQNAEPPVIKFGNTDTSKKENLISDTVLNSFGSISALTYSGTVSTEVALHETEGVTYEYTVSDSQNASKSVKVTGTANYTTKSTGNPYEYTWSFKAPDSTTPQAQLNAISDIIKNQGRYKFEVTVKAKSNGGTSKESRSAIIDTQKPTVKNLAINNSYTAKGTTYINGKGTYTITGLSLDNYELKETSWTLKGKGTGGKAIEKSGSFGNTENWEISEDLSAFAPDVNGADITLTVKASDSAGNTGDEAKLSIELDTNAPVLNSDKIGGVAYVEGQSTSWQKGTSLGVEGKITEKESGVKAIYYQITNASTSTELMTSSNYEKVKTNILYAAQGSEFFTFSQTLSEFKDGENTLRYVIVDNLGNVSDYYERKVKTDAVTPLVRELETTDSDYCSFKTSQFGKDLEKFKFAYLAYDADSGITEDAISVKVGDYTISKADSTYGTLEVSQQSLVVTTNAGQTSLRKAGSGESGVKTGWLVKVSLKNPSSGEGFEENNLYTVTSNINDVAGNTSQTQVGIFSIDMTPPVVTVSKVSGSESFVNGLKQVNAVIKESGEIKKVSYQIFKESDTSFESPLEFYPVKNTSTGELESEPVTSQTITADTSVSFTLRTDGTNSSIFGDDSFVVVVTAEDSAGNVGTANSSTYKIDKTGPELSEDEFKDDLWYNATTLSASGTWNDENGSGASKLYYVLTKTELTGTVNADTIKNNTGKKTVAVSSDGSFNTNIGGFETGKNYLYYVAYDAVGNASGVTKHTIQVDMTKPQYKGGSTDTTTANASSEKEFTVQIMDTGSDINKDSISVEIGDKTINKDATTYGSIEITDDTTPVTGYSNSYTVKVKANSALMTALEEAKINSVNVTALDKAGNRSESTIGYLKVDNTAPLVTIKKESGSNIFVRDTKAFSVTLSDIGEIESISWKVFEKKADDTEYDTANDAVKTGTAIPGTSAEINVNFAEKSGVDYIFENDKEYVLCVKAKDVAGNECTYKASTDGKSGGGISSAYIVDRAGPEFVTSDDSDTLKDETKWYGVSKINVAGKWTDGSKGSGASILYYQINGTTALTKANYETVGKPVSIKNSSFSELIDGFDDKKDNIIRYVAVDGVGNVSEVIEHKVNVDLSAPAFGEITPETFEAKKDDTEKTFTVNVSDTGSGIDTAKTKVTVGSVEVPEESVTYNEGSLTVSVTKDVINQLSDGKESAVKVTVTDKVEHSSDVVAGYIKADFTAPLVTIAKESGNSLFVNSEKTFNVNISDAGNITAVDWGVYEKNATGSYDSATKISGGDNESISLNAEKTEATITVDFAKKDSSESYIFTDAKEYVVCVKATDSAGNVGSYAVVNDANGKAKSGGGISSAYRVDRSGPSLTLSNAGGKAYNAENWYNASSISLSGSCTDTYGTDNTVNGSGAKIIYYVLSQTKIENPEASGIISNTDVKKLSVSENGSFESTLAGFEDGVNYIYFVAEDYTNNISDVKSYSLKVDMTAPKEPEGLTINEKAFASSDIFYTNQGATTENISSTAAVMTVSFTVSDDGTDGSGIDKVYILPYNRLSKNSENTTSEATEADGKWSISLKATTIIKSGKVYARIYDKAGNFTDSTLFDFVYDTEKPALSNHNFEDEKKGFTAYKVADVTEGSGTSAVKKPHYYINTNDKFTLSGSTKDNEGVQKVELWTPNGTEPLAHTEESDFKFENLALSSVSSESDIILKITDKAGNVAEHKIFLTSDTRAPNGLHDKDSLGKDKTFRVGEQKYNNIPVGAKYSQGTYGNASSIKVRGYFEETGSGINMIYYKLFDTVPDENAIKDFVDNYDEKKTGNFGSCPETEQTIQVNKSGSTTGEEPVKYNFITSISGFQEGNNYLVLVAVDNVGNAAVDTISYTYTEEGTEKSSNCYAINVDTVVPELEGEVTAKIDEKEKKVSQILTNFAGEEGKADIVFSGKAKDEDAGLDSVTLSVKVGNETKTVEINESELTAVTGQEKTKGWTATVPASWFTNETSGNFTVYATVKDKAGEGNSQSLSVATITIDKEAPTVVLVEPKDADALTANVREINGIINLSGTAEDANPLPEKAILAIQYAETSEAVSDTSDTGWTDAVFGENDLYGSYTFNANKFDTSKLTDGATYYLRAKAVDAAGNMGYSEKREVKVSQDTDRPVITITSLDNGDDPIISNQVVMGNISDDDGISKLEYKDKSGGWTEVSVNSGAWRIEGDAIAGGSHEFSFQVTDTAGTVFKTGKGEFNTTDDKGFSSDGKPYVVFGSNTLNRTTDKSSTAVTFKVDLTSPEIQSVAVAATSSSTKPEEGAAGSDAASPYDTSNIKSFGGKESRYMWLKIVAKEDVALHADTEKESDLAIKIGSTVLPLKDADENSLIVERTGAAGMEESDAGFTYIVGPFDTSLAALTGGNEGTLTLSVTVTDKSGRPSDAFTKSIYLDKKAPEVTVTSPNVSDGVSSDSIIGKTVLRGEVKDSSKIAKFFYMIPDATTKTAIDTAIDSTAGYELKSAHGWKDLKDVETSKSTEDSPVFNVYENHTSMLWEIPVTSSKFKTKLSDSKLDDVSLSLIEYATAQTGSSLTYAEVSTVESSVNDKNTPAADKKYCVYVPLYFYTEDETGMAKVTATKILVDPYAGIPQLEISAPEDFAKTGGNLNFQGSVTDDAGDADKVVLTTLEFSTVDAVEADFVGTTAKADSTFNWKEVTRDILAETGVVTKGTLDATKAEITAEGKPSSWKISINTSAISTDKDGNLATLLGTQGSGEDEEAKDIKIARATFVAYDKNGTASTFQVSTLPDKADGGVVKNIFVDKNAPKLSDIQLVQYADEEGKDRNDIEITDTPTISRAYTSGMYISGNTGTKQWYLKATITDDASVEGFTISSGKAYIPLSGKAEKGKTATGGIISSDLGDQTCTFIIPLDTDTLKNGNNKKCTQFYATIELDDGQHTDVTQNLSFFVDNDAPGMLTKDDATEAPNDKLGTDAKNLRLKDNGGKVVGKENVVENSDGSYTFGDMIKESGSGLAYIAVWFEKENGTSKTWHSALKSKSLAIGGTGLKINSEGLPVKEFTDCERLAKNTIGNASMGGDTCFGVGSLVKIGGSYHLITDKGEDGKSGTITIDDDVDTTFTKVEVVYAQIVNHQVTEGFEADWSVSNDDNDGFVEMVKQSGSNYKWSASIRSDYIPDGPATIHVVAFDEAGNFNSGYVETSVQNNRPRISKVFLGTDLNGNGWFDYYSENTTGAVAANNELYPGYTGSGTEFGELSFYSALSSDGKIQGNVTLKSSNFVAKDKLLVLPEIIGGNTPEGTDLKYLYKVADTEAGATITKLTTGTTLNDFKATSIATEDAEGKPVATGLPLKDKTGTSQSVSNLIAETEDAADKWNYYKTTTSDFKDDDTHGGTQNARFKGLVLDNDILKDYESWTAGQTVGSVKYFAFTIWDATEGTTQGADSLYALLKVPMVVNVEDDIAPHAYIQPFYWNSKEDGSFCYDEEGVALGHIDIDDGKGTKNPGVSGQIWIKATVTDETRLSSATFTDPGDTKKVVANYTNGRWVPVTTGLPEHWKKVEILDSPEPNQAGHTMSFRVAIDMTSYGLGNNRHVNAGATDKKGTASADEEDQTIDPKILATGKLTSHYIMDFVPYIKSIYPATENSASRSRLGKFPVQAGKPMIIEGMNFKADAEYEYAVEFDTSAKNEEIKTNPDNIWESAEGYYIEDSAITKIENGKISLTAPQYSRYVRVWVKPKDGDWSYTKNNLNENLGCNIEDGYVASDDNGKGNNDRGLKKANDAGTNFWTDDRYIAVWNVEATNNMPLNLKPINGFIKEILSDKIYRRIAVSEEIKLGMNSVKKGNILATWSSTDDLQVYDYVVGDAVEGHTTAGRTFGVNQATFYEAPPYLDMTIVNNVPWYVALDNYVGNNSANDWGAGLFISRQGKQFGKMAFAANNEDWHEVIEFQGKSSSVDGGGREKDRTEYGIDYKKNQFQNPRIAGYLDGDVSYLVVCYYDSFAHCLKYAAYHEEVTTGTGTNGGVSPHLTTNKWKDGSSTFKVDARAAYDLTGKTVIAGSDTTEEKTSFTEDAGQWSDIAMDGATPVIVYYSATAKSLEMVRGTRNNDGTYTWSKTKGIKPTQKTSDFGRYVSMKIDDNHNIHVTAQDALSGKLYYLCLSSTGSVITSHVVDSTSSVGRWTDIELNKPSASVTTGLECEPVISYLDGTKLDTNRAVKVAYVESYTGSAGTKEYRWDSLTDAADYSGTDSRTSIVSSALESNAASALRSKLAVGFNSTRFAVDFLRGED